MTVIETQQPFHYFKRYHIPLISELAVTVHGEIKRNSCNWNPYDPPLFNHVEIETFNRCNNDCAFCPANMHVDKRKPIHLKEEIFSEIVRQLKQLRYTGWIYPFHNNEPLLDSRMASFISEIRMNLPHAGIGVWTNGILLDFDKLTELYSNGLNGKALLRINDYTDDMKMSARMQQLLSDIRGTQIEKDLTIVFQLRDKNARLTRRGGNAPNRLGESTWRVDDWITQKRWCSWPFRQFNVNSSGLVHICCNDVYYENIVGDMNKETMIDIWRGKQLARIRNELNTNGRRNLSPCSRCDTITSRFTWEPGQ
ncbi:MAG: radical SAM/SPASM domain-containing protein [Candidatus Thermoplasmatota archaeon]